MSFGRRRFMHALGLGALAGASAGAAACSNQSAGGGSAPAAGASGAGGGQAPASGAPDADGVPASIRALKPMTDGVVPIGDDDSGERGRGPRFRAAVHDGI